MASCLSPPPYTNAAGISGFAVTLSSSTSESAATCNSGCVAASSSNSAIAYSGLVQFGTMSWNCYCFYEIAWTASTFCSQCYVSASSQSSDLCGEGNASNGYLSSVGVMPVLKKTTAVAATTTTTAATTTTTTTTTTNTTKTTTVNTSDPVTSTTTTPEVEPQTTDSTSTTPPELIVTGTATFQTTRQTDGNLEGGGGGSGSSNTGIIVGCVVAVVILAVVAAVYFLWAKKRTAKGDAEVPDYTPQENQFQTPFPLVPVPKESETPQQFMIATASPAATPLDAKNAHPSLFDVLSGQSAVSAAGPSLQKSVDTKPAAASLFDAIHQTSATSTPSPLSATPIPLSLEDKLKEAEAAADVDSSSPETWSVERTAVWAASLAEVGTPFREFILREHLNFERIRWLMERGELRDTLAWPIGACVEVEKAVLEAAGDVSSQHQEAGLPGYSET